jgi:hypothetical protein
MKALTDSSLTFDRYVSSIFPSLIREMQRLGSWKEDISPEILTVALDTLLPDKSIFHKTSKILISPPSPRTLALSFVILAVSVLPRLCFTDFQVCHNLMVAESKSIPTDITAHLTSFLMPFPGCHRDDIPIVKGQ